MGGNNPCDHGSDIDIRDIIEDAGENPDEVLGQDNKQKEILDNTKEKTKKTIEK